MDAAIFLAGRPTAVVNHTEQHRHRQPPVMPGSCQAPAASCAPASPGERSSASPLCRAVAATSAQRVSTLCVEAPRRPEAPSPSACAAPARRCASTSERSCASPSPTMGSVPAGGEILRQESGRLERHRIPLRWDIGIRRYSPNRAGRQARHRRAAGQCAAPGVRPRPEDPRGALTAAARGFLRWHELQFGMLNSECRQPYGPKFRLA